MILLEEMEGLSQNITTNNRPKFFILDVDGVMTSGQFFYSENGKEMKIFGPDDNDGLSLLLPYLSISFVREIVKDFQSARKE